MECSVVEDNGYTFYYKTGTEKLHREDGPAFISPNGYEAWYKNGKLHREDGPATVSLDGSPYWFLNGKELTEEEFNKRMKYDVITNLLGAVTYYKKGTDIVHREDGPAITYQDGREFWYIDGELHREDGPAVVYPSGRERWYIDGKLHREDGPAIKGSDGAESWYIEGEELTEEEFNYRMKYDVKIDEQGVTRYYKKGTNIAHREEGPALIYPNGDQYWFLNGTRQRVVHSDGSQFWYHNGKLHREDGPAVISTNGSQFWLLNGEYHREDGPAIVPSDGSESWHLNGEELSEEEFNERMKYDVLVVEYGHRFYYKKGTKTLHREEGPAVIFSHGERSWYIEGEELTEEEFNYRMNIKNAVKAAETMGDIDISDQLNTELRGNQIGGDHYISQDIQPWDYMESTMTEEQFIGYLRGNVLKYVSRYDKKGGLQDLNKAMHYLEKLMSCL